MRKDKLAVSGITNGQLGMGTRKDKAYFTAKSLIAEALDADERIERILQQPWPSTDQQGIIADEDYEAPRNEPPLTGAERGVSGVEEELEELEETVDAMRKELIRLRWEAEALETAVAVLAGLAGAFLVTAVRLLLR